MDVTARSQILDRCEIVIDEDDEAFWAVVGERVVAKGGEALFLTAVLSCDEREPSLWITADSIFELLVTGEGTAEERRMVDECIVEDISSSPFGDEIQELFQMVGSKAEER